MDAEDDLELVIHRARAAIARAKILSGSLTREASEGGPQGYAVARGQENLSLTVGSETTQGDNAEISGLPSHGGGPGQDTAREGPLGPHAVPGNRPTLGEVSGGVSSHEGRGMTEGTSGLIRSQGGMTQAVEDTLEAAASLRVYLHAQVGGLCLGRAPSREDATRITQKGSFSGGCYTFLHCNRIKVLPPKECIILF